MDSFKYDEFKADPYGLSYQQTLCPGNNRFQAFPKDLKPQTSNWITTAMCTCKQRKYPTAEEIFFHFKWTSGHMLPNGTTRWTSSERQNGGIVAKNSFLL